MLPLNQNNSFQSILYCSKGSLCVMSSIKTKILVLSMCLKNQKPSPLFWCASSMIPGISATVIEQSSTNLTCPTDGFKVVNSQLAIFGIALVVAAKKVDLPMFGKPTKPISANVFNQRQMILLSPSCPNLYYSFMNGCTLFPFPAAPPWATKTSSLSFPKSMMKFLVSFYQSILISQMSVPQGTLITVFPPSLPCMPLAPPFFPSTPSIVFSLRCERSCIDRCACTIMLPPFPPSPPSGAPVLILLSVQYVITPLPPLPAFIANLTLSEKFLSQNFDIFLVSVSMISTVQKKLNLLHMSRCIINYNHVNYFQ